MNGYPDSLTRERIHRAFLVLYGDRAERCERRFAALIGRYALGDARPAACVSRWDQRDAVLITYGDSIQSTSGSPLDALRAWVQQRLGGAFNTLHILPFFPSSSDDGFSVIHYRMVDPRLGTWADVKAIGQHITLMFDLVLNHVSRQSGWFLDYETGIAPGRHYFIEGDPSWDLSAVTRPRNLPLLTPVNTRSGPRHVWTTFSVDQIDLNFASPDVLFEMIDILMFYVAQGARILRLDAVAYLWKRPGTSCIHLEETHLVVKILRDVLSLVAPDVILLTETNVPHRENVSYFGQGDEAHWVYQFSLPPLLLYTLVNGTARALTDWAAQLSTPPSGCTFLNFTASHDGIGVRPLEGLVPPEAIRNLAQVVAAQGGEASWHRLPDGSESVYELNSTYYDALASDATTYTDMDRKRFLCSQILAMSFQGIPALYINSLIAARNDHEGYRRTGQPRRLNRQKWFNTEWDSILATNPAVQEVFDSLLRYLRIRVAQPAFHPEGPQRVLRLDDDRLFALRRVSPDGSRSVTVVCNVSDTFVSCSLRHVDITTPVIDLITETAHPQPEQDLLLAPYQTVWLSPDGRHVP